MKSTILCSIAFTAAMLSGCVAATGGEQSSDVQIGNPASQFCAEQGGKTEIREEKGGQAGYCRFPDGRVVDEWVYYREHHAAQTQSAQIANPASEYCIKQGGRLEIRKEADGEAGYCHLPNGKVVEEWAYFRAQNPIKK